MTSSGGGGSSTLSTESPPFNPRGIRGVGSQSPAPNLSNHNRSRTASPVSNSSTSGGESFSNAIAKHTFQYEGKSLEIRNVWAENVEEEMSKIRELIETHPYVAMDTEFPGVVARPVSETYSPDFHYKSLKVNVDLLKIIQLGLSFADEEGNFAEGCPCWQFNFKFNLNDDMFAQDSIDLLVNSGISFDDHATRGIDPMRFGEILMVSGLVLDERVRWVSFHSGYDYGYLLKLLTTQELPSDEKTFFETLKLYFPTIYDIKYMTSLCDGHFGGLQKLADALKCQRVGAEHQAGSDSLLTMTTYFSLGRAKFANGPTNEIDDSKYRNELYGYGGNHTVRKGNAHAHVHLSNSSSALSVSNGSSSVSGE
jgi:CCR4-NOT transcription complex subunit 7/8